MSSLVEVNVSAPGKVILHGDHSVVYGKLAVAASLGLRTNLKLQETNTNNLELNFNTIELHISYPLEELKSKLDTILISGDSLYDFEHPECINQDEVLKSINAFLDEKASLDATTKTSVLTVLYLYSCILFPSGIAVHSIRLEIETELQIGAGMGSSASFCVVLACGFIEYVKRKCPSCLNKVKESFKWLHDNDSKILNERELKSINLWAYQAERITHGNPSGIDNTICTYGSVVQFRKGTEPILLPMDIKLQALLIDTKVSRNTKALVSRVAELKNRMPDIIENIINSMEGISQKAIEYLLKLNKLEVMHKGCRDEKVNEFRACYQLLEEVVDMNQNMLRILNVSHPEIENILRILREHSFVGKLTGAGGGGFVLAIVPFYTNREDLVYIKAALTKANYPAHLLDLGGDGVKVH